ncbi:hypothetical protein KC960_03980 [Candidatus Saccharibacteria bacterium]|nr:hypothetical protein [Candidatus Saccharibacteria bacterium]
MPLTHGSLSHNEVHGQDAFIVDTKGYFFAVGDGVSNIGPNKINKSGEVAKVALEAASYGWRKKRPSSAMKSASRAVGRLTIDGVTTLTGVGISFVDSKRIGLSVLHIGDSGVALATRDSFRRITPAHNAVDRSNVLAGFLKAGVGLGGIAKPFYQELELDKDANFTLALFTDGAYDGYREDRLHSIMMDRGTGAQATANQMLASNPYRGRDDATVVVLKNLPA